MSFKGDFWIKDRRALILRFLVEAGGRANESTIVKAAFHGGFAADTADDVALDLNHLVRMQCLTERRDAEPRVLILTAFGEDAARGKVEVPGVTRSRWEPAEG